MKREDNCRLLHRSETISYKDINKYTVLFGKYSDEKTELTRRIIDIIKPKTSDVVLDIGCGEGYLLKALSTFVRKCVGIDPDPTMLKVARRKLANAPNVELGLTKFEDYETDEAFDAIVASHTLSFFKDKLVAIRKMIHHAREGGTVIIVSHSPTGEQFRMLEEFHYKLRGRSLNHISAEVLYECLKSLGFNPILQFVKTRAILPSVDVAMKLNYFLFRADNRRPDPTAMRLAKSLLESYIANGQVPIETTHGIIVLNK